MYVCVCVCVCVYVCVCVCVYIGVVLTMCRLGGLAGYSSVGNLVCIVIVNLWVCWEC